MSLSRCLNALFEDGRVVVGSLTPRLDPHDLDDAALRLAECDADVRAEFPGEPPALAIDVALWAAERFYRACQLVVYREAGPEVAAAALTGACPTAPRSAQHYSADLVWRFVPDLHRLAKALSPDDPLVFALRQFALNWPLSGVGIPWPQGEDDAIVVRPSLEGIADHPALWAHFVDRVIARRDKAWLAEPAVRSAVQAALGLHVHLAPTFEKAWKSDPGASLLAPPSG